MRERVSVCLREREREREVKRREPERNGGNSDTQL